QEHPEDRGRDAGHHDRPAGVARPAVGCFERLPSASSGLSPREQTDDSHACDARTRRETQDGTDGLSMAIKAVRGVRDILPSETGRWQRGGRGGGEGVEGAGRTTFEAYGYREIRLPLFERTELFARGIGDETDIVKKEMYTFEDRGGDSPPLPPEGRAGLVRAYIEHGFQVEPKPVRLYTAGPMFRYERPQAGRYRQFHQANIESLGEASPPGAA